MSKKYRKAIIFLTENFQDYGGVERRVKQYAQLWQEKGWSTFIACLSHRAVGVDIYLWKHSRLYNTLVLIWWRIFHHVQVVEWQCGGSGKIRFYIYPLQWFGIKVGVIFHGKAPARAAGYISCSNYACCVSQVQQVRFPALLKCLCVPNSLTFSGPMWQFTGQTQAVFISRLDRDKIASFRAFIRFCAHNKISVDIIGDGDCRFRLERWSRWQYLACGLTPPCFLGKADGPQFLSKHFSKYLFAGAVGLAALEAGIQNMPVLIASSAGETNCFFIKKNNLNNALQYNCSPHTKQESRYFKTDICCVSSDVKQLRCGQVKFFCVSAEILEIRAFKKISVIYWENIWK